MTGAPDMDAALDGLQADMAEHQRRHGAGEVTADANRALAADAIERLDRQRAEAPVPAPAAPVARPELERREVAGRSYVAGKAPDDITERPATETEAWFLEHAMPRIAQLLALREGGVLGQPSWRDRTLAVMQIYESRQALRVAASNPVELARQQQQVARLGAVAKLQLFRTLGIDSPRDITAAFAAKKAEELTHRFMAELRALLDESDKLGFGAWQADPDDEDDEE